ncbi:nicotianamine synthase family protein [Peribacillus sp. SI8-4]|uniref:nicotianamine synthase family protein n=1 Tax=Peribacillus sp. SI8-4 TaxID=3048009 RepID=UPI0025539230|nr:nicotianamine synthase family protein [Peribacillus sp. SI8-4]
MKAIKRSRNQEKIIHTYVEAYQTLQQEADLSPGNPIINRVLSELVSVISKPLDQHLAEEILHLDEIQSIRSGMLAKLAIAEALMEEYYAESYVGKVRTLEDFRSFLYWRNYQELIQTEINELQKVKSGIRSFAFVGSGPLPLSPLLLQHELGANMTCLDIDEQAYSLGRRIIQQLEGEATAEYVLNDGALHDYREFDLIWIASLVPNKADILKRIYQTQPEAIVAIRSADGIHQLLYEPVDATKFHGVRCEEVARTIADSFIINSTIYYRFKQ